MARRVILCCEFQNKRVFVLFVLYVCALRPEYLVVYMKAEGSSQQRIFEERNTNKGKLFGGQYVCYYK